jgi:hypothetical protein
MLPKTNARQLSPPVRSCGSSKFFPSATANVTVAFKRLIQTILRGVTNEACFAFLENVIVDSWTLQGKLVNLRKVFQIFRGTNLKLKPGKREQFQKVDLRFSQR